MLSKELLVFSFSKSYRKQALEVKFSHSPSILFPEEHLSFLDFTCVLR